MRTLNWQAWLCACMLLAGFVPSSASAAVAREYQVKAVFLFNFTHFITWPPEQFADAKSPLVIGVLGDDPFGNYLDETLRGEKVDGRSLVVARYRTVDEASGCQVLFISDSNAQQIAEIVARLRDRGVLTVTDGGGNPGAGGIIRFVTENNHVRLQIDAHAAKAAGLTISSKLLRASEIIGDGD